MKSVGSTLPLRTITIAAVIVSLIAAVLAWSSGAGHSGADFGRAADVYDSTVLQPLASQVEVGPEGRIRDLGNSPRPIQRYVGKGGELIIRAPLDRAPTNRVRLAAQFREATDEHSLVLRYRTADGPVQTAVARRRTIGAVTQLEWVVPKPLIEARIAIPAGADFQVLSLTLDHMAVASGWRLFWFSASVSIAVLALCLVIMAWRRASLAEAGRFGAALVSSIAASVLLSRVGYNFDVESFEIVARLVQDGQVVYAETNRYNYGLVWSEVLHGIARLNDWLGFAGTTDFHSLISLVIALGNVAIALLLACVARPDVGSLFLVLPPALLLAGYHSQFDNWAVAVALASWQLYRAGEQGRNTGRLVVATLLLALSLGIKHIFAFFPICLLLCAGAGKLQHRVAYGFGAAALFALHFVPLLLDEAVRTGLVNHVFRYDHGAPNGIAGVAGLLLNELAPGNGDVLRADLLGKVLWLSAIAAAGLFARGSAASHLPLIYLAVFTAFSPSLADQHLLIPLAFCVLWWRNPWSWLYIGVATIILIDSPTNIGGAWTLHGMLGGKYLRWLGFAIAQGVLAVAVIQYLARRDASPVALPAPMRRPQPVVDSLESVRVRAR